MAREIAEQMWSDVLDDLTGFKADQIDSVDWIQAEEVETAAFREVRIRFKEPIHFTVRT